MTTENFEQDFQAALNKLEEDAKAVGMTLTSICRATGVSRATPDRWRKTPPKTVELLRQMQEVVARAGQAPGRVYIDGIQQGMAAGVDGQVKDKAGLHTDE